MPLAERDLLIAPSLHERRSAILVQPLKFIPQGVGMWKSVLMTTLAIAGVAATATSLGADKSAPVDFAALQAKDPSTSIQTLYEQCTGDIPKRNICTAYIVGVSETLSEIGLQKSARSSGICFNGLSIDYAASVQVFKNWAEKHPEAWGLIRYAGVMWALKETWPCK